MDLGGDADRLPFPHNQFLAAGLKQVVRYQRSMKHSRPRDIRVVGCLCHHHVQVSKIFRELLPVDLPSAAGLYHRILVGVVVQVLEAETFN